MLTFIGVELFIYLSNRNSKYSVFTSDEFYIDRDPFAYTGNRYAMIDNVDQLFHKTSWSMALFTTQTK
ncbi:MAG TPA: hypothetical protein DCS87_06840 [Rheinheimera sp.]|nr:hypothetical protein [Rheinheimera sp.]